MKEEKTQINIVNKHCPVRSQFQNPNPGKKPTENSECMVNNDRERTARNVQSRS
jgi:hypothetical protein